MRVDDPRVCVDYDQPVGQPIGECCPDGDMILILYRGARRSPEGGMEFGYIIESRTCDCQPRWLLFDWRLRDPEFLNTEGKRLASVPSLEPGRVQ